MRCWTNSREIWGRLLRVIRSKLIAIIAAALMAFTPVLAFADLQGVDVSGWQGNIALD